ncbi:dihydropteroate synthase [Acidocella aminolytica]|uniref:Dihydropteroate synthase n=1 Tax=Acidocella aminolytica 101 = DSM 11237 TaxID=1120923 RepID=A0A0D6PJ18_9PROT|nr:dihydropteroate synthase [Acidocella aminolytica]GAN81735.1 dihydropteroate synthase [Acidocella aminolytica 101 = DSM 11237]GBQ36103.1 dihydropteroate synthase [Acidocella aminolytica 101 = DSM 11237]SHF43815.1 Dihydropteroate synthase [Acidocella aminolytica 101 = DSM 11237]
MGEQLSEWAGLRLDVPLVMGILNVTPDSFSDGGRHTTPKAAIAAGRRMLAEGADILDIGGESTRPGAAPVTPEEEKARIQPVVRALAAEGAVISLDTRNALTMAAGLEAGARIINDISALTYDPAALPLVAALACPVVLMHMRGTPATMNDCAIYHDIAREVTTELTQARDSALAAGVKPGNICLDPGLGFAKLGAQNEALLRATGQLAALGHPLLVALSRKRFLGEISGETEAARRDPESLAAGLYAVAHGAHILRVHDVAGTKRALRVWQRLTERNDG